MPTVRLLGFPCLWKAIFATGFAFPLETARSGEGYTELRGPSATHGANKTHRHWRRLRRWQALKGVQAGVYSIVYSVKYVIRSTIAPADQSTESQLVGWRAGQPITINPAN